MPYNGVQKYRKTLQKLRCRCHCGLIFEPFKTNVLRAKTTQCNHCQNSKHSPGEKVGKLTLKSREVDDGVSSWICECECGWSGKVPSSYFLFTPLAKCIVCRYPKKYSVRVKRTRIQQMNELAVKKHEDKKDSLIGTKQGRLKILSFSHWIEGKERRRSVYHAVCKCGNKVLIRYDSPSKSCGCLQKESVPKAENHPHALLSQKDADAIRKLLKADVGYCQRNIAQIYGVSESVISGIATDKTYKAK